MKPLAVVGALIMATLAYQWPSDHHIAAGFALFVLAAVLWLTEAIHVTYTALLIPLVAILLGLADVNTALSGFSHPIIALFLGGFALAAALSAQGIDRWLASGLVNSANGRPVLAAMLLSLVTALLSMWISNTAAAAMMLPIALGLVLPLAKRFPRYMLFVLLALAWGANVGGVTTLVGSPPNAIVAAALDWGFTDWLRIGIPAFLLLWPLVLLVLYVGIRPEADMPRVSSATRAPFPQHRDTWLTLGIFVITVGLWVFGEPLAARIGLNIQGSFDSAVALLAIALLAVSGVLPWKNIEQHANWGVLLLFGGGITLSMVMQLSGTSAWMAEGVSQVLPGQHPWLIYLLLALFVVFLTELVSNTASAALLVPLFMPVAELLGVSTVITAALIGIMASCAFMLPVATPPNALVFGTGNVAQRDMIRLGLRLNLLAAVLLALLLPTVL